MVQLLINIIFLRYPIKKKCCSFHSNQIFFILILTFMTIIEERAIWHFPPLQINFEI